MKRAPIQIPRLVPVLVLALAAALAAACVPKPRIEYTSDQLLSLNETKELMRVLYHGLRPVWDSDKKSAFSAADYKAMAGAAPRVLAVSKALQFQVGRKYPKDFAARAAELGKHAAALEKAAADSQEPAARGAIKGLNASCKSCHSKYK
ncbi:MAG: cytochrome c [bacterium]